MPLRNDRGEAVDAVPFGVTATGGFLVLYSFGPGYLMGLGVSLGEALVAVTGLYACTVAVGYHQLVLRARPEQRGEVPGPVRMKRLYYAVLIALAVFVLLMLPYHV